MIFQGKVVNLHDKVGYVYVAVPQVSSTNSLVARISPSARPNPGDLVWVLYEDDDFARPAVIPAPMDSEVEELKTRVRELEEGQRSEAAEVSALKKLVQKLEEQQHAMMKHLKP